MRVFLFLGLADAKWRFAIYLTNGKRRPAKGPRISVSNSHVSQKSRLVPR
jgi:hypothetical protein